MIGGGATPSFGAPQQQSGWSSPYPQNPGNQAQPGFPPQTFAPSSKDKMTAALLAIFLGGFGIHKFYLGGSGQKTAGVIQLVLTIFTCGLAAIIPFIEGIIYLTKDDQVFQAEYALGDKNWF